VAFLTLDGGWGYVRGEVRGPRSPVLDLVQAVYEAHPDRARALLRQRIRATVLAPFDADVVKVTAKRVALVTAADGPVDGLVDLSGFAERARARVGGVDGGVVATLSVDGTAVLTARNAASENRTLHAELALAQAWWARTGRPIPAGARLETSLQCCRMCAAVLVASVAGPIDVVYAEPDPGRFARGTALQRLGWERRAGA
jgi:tRNA(Arg) A34 adenosine deaminase TadA